MKALKAKTFKTNVELVTDVMEFSPYGALSQMFVIEAITRYAAACAAADPKKFDSPLLNGEAWVGVAKDIRDRFAQNYGGPQ